VPTVLATRDGAVAGLADWLVTEGVTVRFGGRVAVDRVSIHVGAGEIVGLIGTNGAGKTTLLNAISGFVPARGRIEMPGQDVSTLPPTGATDWPGSIPGGSLDDLTVRDGARGAGPRAPCGVLRSAAVRAAWWSEEGAEADETARPWDPTASPISSSRTSTGTRVRSWHTRAGRVFSTNRLPIRNAD
jgi:energy-coupling factor transporter ATP-binding protein EcfA2